MRDRIWIIGGRIWRFLRWAGTRELAVLAGLFVVAVGTWGFINLAGEVMEGDTQAVDNMILRAMRRADAPTTPIGPIWLPELVRDMTALGGYLVLVLVTLAVTGFLWLDHKYAVAAYVLAAILSGFLVTMGLKEFFERPRPQIIEHLHQVDSASFPSGHSMMSAVVYLTLGTLLTALVKSKRLKVYFLSVAVVLTVLVGFSRVYLGVHYPTDVLAGWAAGLVWSTACWLLARQLQRKGTIEKEE